MERMLSILQFAGNRGIIEYAYIQLFSDYDDGKLSICGLVCDSKGEVLIDFESTDDLERKLCEYN